MENIEGRIKTAVDDLLRLVKMHCWNSISSNIVFILSDVNEFEGVNFFDLRTSRKKVNGLKAIFTFQAAVEILNKEYHDLYDISLYIFRACKKETVIEIQYYRKSDLKPDYYTVVKDYPPMLHSKISIPSYALEGEKFDINWELGGGIDHSWKSFLYKLKNRQKFKR